MTINNAAARLQLSRAMINISGRHWSLSFQFSSLSNEVEEKYSCMDSAECKIEICAGSSFMVLFYKNTTDLSDG